MCVCYVSAIASSPFIDPLASICYALAFPVHGWLYSGVPPVQSSDTGQHTNQYH
jgi:hypothetical protein